MGHERLAKAVSVILLGSDAWNRAMEANATHLPKYRMILPQLQQSLMDAGTPQSYLFPNAWMTGLCCLI
jgi:hypothetical protein